jgi:hypothetical protein
MNFLLLLEAWPLRLQETVAVESPVSFPESTVHVQDTRPAESATCFFLSPAASDAFPEWYLMAALHEAPGEVRAASMTTELAVTEAGRFVISTASAGAAAVAVGTGAAVGPAVGPAVGMTVGIEVGAEVGAEVGSPAGVAPEIVFEVGEAIEIEEPAEVTFPGLVAWTLADADSPAATGIPVDPPRPGAAGLPPIAARTTMEAATAAPMPTFARRGSRNDWRLGHAHVSAATGETATVIGRWHSPQATARSASKAPQNAHTWPKAADATGPEERWTGACDFAFRSRGRAWLGPLGALR